MGIAPFSHCSPDRPKARFFHSRDVASPLGEVHLSTSIIDVTDGEPRDGSDIRVPPPVRLVAVAVVCMTWRTERRCQEERW
jgi:hypothetical protein